MKGDTNIKYLVDNKVNIWNQDAYRWYLKFLTTMEEPDYDYVIDDASQFKTRALTMEEFIEAIKLGNIGDRSDYKLGDLGKVYGFQWRNQNGVDQVRDVYEGLTNTPYSRYHIINGWQKSDFSEMALPPCHLLYHFLVRPLTLDQRLKEYYDSRLGFDHKLDFDSDEEAHDFLTDLGVPLFFLDLNMYQRSADTLCGIPFNLASMSLFLMIMSKGTNMIGGIPNWIGGDTHIYESHIDRLKEQLKRKPFELPKMEITKELKSLEDIMDLTIDDFKLTEYKSHPKIKCDLYTGLKKEEKK
jgi:thymidylate synthase